MALQPFKLGSFHFRRELTADIIEHFVAAGVDGRGFHESAVVHPHDYVSLRVAVQIHGKWLILSIEYDE